MAPSIEQQIQMVLRELQQLRAVLVDQRIAVSATEQEIDEKEGVLQDLFGQLVLDTIQNMTFSGEKITIGKDDIILED